jgi:hypothetical protein
MQSPEMFVEDIYQKVKVEDRFMYVYEGDAPCYHQREDCERLNAEFRNFIIPHSIRERGTDCVIRFREWFKENIYLLDGKKDIFEMHLQMKFNIHRSEIEIIDRKNSGTQEFDNYSLTDLCNQIQELTRQFKAWLIDSTNVNERSLRVYSFNEIAYKGTCTYWGDDYGAEKYLVEIHKRNKSKFTDQEISDCLKEAHTKYKLPMIELLKKYYMIKYNADTKVDVNILEALGFRPCSACCSVRELGSKYDWEDIEI